MSVAVQLVPARPDFQTRRQVELIGRAVRSTFGLKTCTLHSAEGWVGAVRSFASLDRRAVRSADFAHAWGAEALALAVVSGARRIVYSPVTFPTRRAVGWLRSLLDHRDAHVVCTTSTMRRAYVERGVPLERCHLIRPAVDFARIKRRRVTQLRAALGFADTDVVLMACGESTPGASHATAIWAASILHQLDAKFRVLLWGQGSAVDLMRRFGDNVCSPGFVSVAQDRLEKTIEFEDLLPAIDVVLVTPTTPQPTLAIATCMAAGLPIIATTSYTIAEMLEDRHTALLVPRPKPRDVARRVLDLIDDPGLQWSISDMAKTEAFEFFSVSRFSEQWRTVYDAVARGLKVEVIEPAPGAGLRFHGRV